MLNRQITDDKWLVGKQHFMGQRLCVDKSYVNGHSWSFYVEYVGLTLMCVTYVDEHVKDMFPFAKFYM